MTISELTRDRLGRRRALRAIVVDRQERSASRRRRRGTYWSLAAALLLLLVAAAPSLVCHSPLAAALVGRVANEGTLTSSFKSIRFGWITPLRLTQVELTGTTAGTRLRVDRLDCDLTLLGCLGGLPRAIETSFRGVTLELAAEHGKTSLERDLAAILADDSDSDTDHDSSDRAQPTWLFDIQNLTVRVSDPATGAFWGIDQAHLEAQIGAEAWETSFSAVLSEPQAGSGSLDAVVRGSWKPETQLQADVNVQGLPLGALTLVRRRMPDSAAAIPAQLAGDATGTARCALAVDGTWSLVMSPLELRNLVISDPQLGDRVWRNGLAVAEGTAILGASGWTGEKLRITTDFAQLEVDGSYARPASTETMSDSDGWLTAFEGTATASLDLVTMAQRLPGVLPLREQTELISGALTGEIVSQRDAPASRRIVGRLQSQAISARAAGRHITIDPAAVVASLQVDQNGLWKADRCQLTSSFGSATLDGDLSGGRATADVNLGRLAAMLEPILDLPGLSLGGVAAGELEWAAQPGDQWRLQGDAKATDLVIGFPGGLQMHRPTLAAQVDATGRWDGSRLSELTAADVSLRSRSLQADASLLASVANPTIATALPLRLRGQGRLEVLAEFLGPWLPQSLHSLHGGFEGRADASIGTGGGEVSVAKIELQQPRGGWNERLYEQEHLAMDFEGRYAWPAGDCTITTLVVTGDAISGSAQGTVAADRLDCRLAWRAKLGALQQSTHRLASLRDRKPGIPTSGTVTDLNVRSATFAGPPRMATTMNAAEPQDRAWRITGDCDGEIRLSRSGPADPLAIEARATAIDLIVMQPSDAVTVTPNTNRPSRNDASMAAAEAILWNESKLDAGAVLVYHFDSGLWGAKQLQLTGECLSTTLAGEVRWDEAEGKVRLSGPARVDTEQLATRLSALAGMPIELVGVHGTPLDISVDRQDDGEVAVRVAGNLSWESGEVAGLVLGPASMPMVLSETSLTVQRSAIPVDPGRIYVGGEVHYSPGPLSIQVQPGVIAQNLRLTPELSQRWLQYLAPAVARAAQIDGSFGVELSEATINLAQPRRSRVRGQLQINHIDFDSGPVTDQLIASIEQIQMLARGRSVSEKGTATAGPKQGRRLASLPTQSVDFDFAEGVVRHQRMFMEIDRAQLVTSGAVDVDGRLDLVTQVPLKDAWLGSDLKALAGRTVTLPVSGTLTRPRLDPAAIRDLVTQIGAQAIQSGAENYLEKQLNRGLEKLLGK